MINQQIASARTGKTPLRIALSAALLAGVVALSPVSPLGVSPASAADVFTAPVNLSGASQITTLPQVTTDSSGRAVAVWLRATVNDTSDPALCDVLDKCVVDAAQFNPTTQQWSAPQTLSSGTENATQADVLINGSGEAMAIWRRTSGAGSTIQAELFNGTAWVGPPTDLPSVTTGSPRGPQLSVSPTGVFTVVWYRTFNASTNLVESRQYTGSWQPLRTLSLNENAELSRVASDNAGNVVALWQGQLTLGGPTFVRASRFTGGAWTAPVTVGAGVTLPVPATGDPVDPVFGTLAPQLAIDPTGNATAVWHQTDGTNTVIRTSRYTIANDTWGAPQVLSAGGAGNALNARVESDSAGNATALWRRFDAPLPKGHSIIQTARYSIATGTWSTAIDLSSPGRESQSQRLAVDPAGNVTAVWRRNNADGISIIQSSRYSPVAGVWSAARDLSEPDVDSTSPSTDVDQNGNVIVVWAHGSVIQASRSTAEVIPGFVSVSPVRVFDTRPGESLNALRAVSKVKVGGTYTLAVKVAELPGGITPATGIGAVSMNVTVVDPNAAGFLTVYPCGAISEVSNVNFVAGQTVANAVIAPVSADGNVCFFSNTPTHVLADLNGYFPTGSGYTAVGPKRVLDTRPGQSPSALLTVAKAKIGGTVELVAHMASLPGGTTPASGVGAVSLNVAVSNPVNSGFVTVYPCHDRALVSSVNFVAGQTVANAVIAPVSDTGDVCFFSNVDTDIIVDIGGWFPSESGYAPADSPARVFDTRANESPDALRDADVPKTKIGGTNILTVHMANLTDVTPPVGVAAVALNVTVTNPVGPGFVTVYPCGTLTQVSSVNFVAGQTVANAVIAPLSASGDLCFYSNLDTDLIVDINGFFAI